MRCLLQKTLLNPYWRTHREIYRLFQMTLLILLGRMPLLYVSLFHIFFFLFTLVHQELKKCTFCTGPSHVHEDCCGPIDPNNMDLGNSSYLISLSGISHLFLDDPEVSVPDAKATARPSSVCLPYALVPGMDTTSRAYQKAAALLGQVVQETSNPRPTLPLGYTLSETSFGN